MVTAPMQDCRDGQVVYSVWIEHDGGCPEAQCIGNPDNLPHRYAPQARRESLGELGQRNLAAISPRRHRNACQSAVREGSLPDQLRTKARRDLHALNPIRQSTTVAMKISVAIAGPSHPTRAR